MLPDEIDHRTAAPTKTSAVCGPSCPQPACCCDPVCMTTMKKDWDKRIPDHILMHAIFLRVKRPESVPPFRIWRHYTYRCLWYDPDKKRCLNYTRRPYVCRTFLCEPEEEKPDV